jgi:hypothetical protein
MPCRSLHNPEFDNLPAYGLRDDAFEDGLREQAAYRQKYERDEAADRAAQRLLGRDEDDEGDADDEPLDDADLGRQEWRPANRADRQAVRQRRRLPRRLALRQSRREEPDVGTGARRSSGTDRHTRAGHADSGGRATDDAEGRVVGS